MVTDQEINEAVAKQLGWIRDNDGWTLKGHPWFKNVPDYCHSIEAAWAVVQEMLPGPGIWNERGVWVVSRLDFSGLGETLAEAATAPMAISLAYLKLNA